jgi:hypothetical protein|tara:strand:- start:2040 stop:2237 length:198 start_codon:yes stop_codon:yes gene_type:complete
MKNEISLDEIIEWTRDNNFTHVGGDGELYIGSDGEEMYEDEIIEIIAEDKKATEETYKFLYWWAR